MEQSKSKGGRPPKPESDRLVQRSIRLPLHLWAKIDAAGLVALRVYLDRWRIKPPAG